MAAPVAPSSKSPGKGELAHSTAERSARVSMADFDRLTATFRDRMTEKDYRGYLATSDLPQQRLIWLFMTGVYFLYGALDLFTIGDRLGDVLIMRWLIITPLALGLGALTFVERLKPFTGHLFAACVFLSAISVTWMISILPAQGSPPYIVGILIIFIFSSCNVQMPFLAASSAYLLTTVAYAVVILGNPDFTRTDIIAGLFFMISSAGAAIATNYVQEIRLRMIWITNVLRARDARRIEELMIEATAADSSKINFLSVLTHELRTPLHQVIGLSEVVRNQVEQRNFNEAPALLTQVIDSAQGQLKKIGQMLRYADATAGRLTFDYDNVPVRELIEPLHDQVAAKAAARQVSLHIGHTDNEKLRVDPHHASYALANLIDNAINACQPGGAVTISGRKAADDSYAVEISDTGSGISQSRLATLFSPFEQADKSYSRAGGGVGLGLTLAQRLLSPQGATITLNSIEGRGTTATVAFKAAAASEKQIEKIA